MRFQGRISNWNDAKGFGTITWHGSSDRVFVHISAFSSGSRRPVENDIVTYEVAKDEKGRFKAVNVSFPQSPLNARSGRLPKDSGRSSMVSAALFLAYFLFCAATGSIPFFIFKLYFGASLLCFLVYCWDKSAARHHRWRTPESTLHLLALLGGWPGALAAQKLFRHKTVKQPFQSVFVGTIMLNFAVFVIYTSPQFASVFHTLLAR